MSDYNKELSELYQRAVQIVLQLPARIDEDGDVYFEHPHLGELYIAVNGSNPERMDLVWMINRLETHAPEDLLRICNSVNLTPWPVVLTVDENLIVSANVALFVAAEGRMPDEALIRAVIGQAMSVIEGAIEAFEVEIQKLDNAPTA